jgi:hypothetical protein
MGMLRATWRRLFCGFLVVALVFGNIVLTTSTASAVGGITGSVSGTVVDESKNPVPGAAITIASPSGTYHGRTDDHGAFAVLGILADTYVISVQKSGYQTTTLQGITITGDNALSLGSITLGRTIIGRTRARSANSAYQPNQTIDSTTLSGARVQQALGSPTNTDETQLILAAPGTAVSSSGNVTIRGSLSTEIGYQYDGVNFTSPFFDENGSNGYIINLSGGVGGSLQVVSGSGDATQGNVGAGVINIVPPRGTYPATGDLAGTVGGPSYKHQLDFDYAIASGNGRVSDYFSYDGQRYVPGYPLGISSETLGAFGGTSYVKHDDTQNNFVYRFGKDNDQSLQVLLRVSDDQDLGNYGGLSNSQYYFYNPLVGGFFAYNPVLGNATLASPGNLGYGSFQNAFTSLFQALPGLPSPTAVNPTQPEEIGFNPLHFLKVGYTKNFGAATFLNADYYEWGTLSGGTNYTGGSYLPQFNEVGGTRVGFDVNITHQFGTAHTVTLATKYENGYPQWNNEDVGYTNFGLALGELYQAIGQEAPGFTYWAVPTAHPGQPISATNPCPYNPFGSADPCYIYSYLQAHGLYTGLSSMPQIPTFGLDYHDADFQMWGIGLRDQWTVTPKLKLDYGIRDDGAQYKFGPNSYAYNVYGNPSDLSNNLLTASFLTPRTVQPRVAASYQIGPNDSVRASYGRSTEYAFAQLAGTPMGIFNVNSVLNSIPATDSAAAPACGSGYASGPGYTANPGIPFSGAAITGSGVGNYFKCTSLAQQIFWLYDQQLDAPDYGGQGQETFSNYDLAYSHQFTSGLLAGWGTKITGFGRRGFNIIEDVLLTEGPPNPVTGQSSGTVFSTRPDGVEKTSGLEFQVTTPDRAVGFSGFASATYLAVFGSNPPASNGGAFASDSLPPLVTTPILETGVLFRQTYVAPFQARTGITYKSKSGLSITPILSGTTGYPFGVGTSTVGTNNGSLGYIPSTNFGQAAPLAGPNGPGNAYNASAYVDPAYPGSYLNPTIAATRGYSEPALAGGHLTNPTTNADINIEQSLTKRLSFGVYISNLWDSHSGLPYQNTKWQPVATGVGGPQTGQNDVNANPNSPDYAAYVAGARDQWSAAGGFTPFSFVYQQGRTVQVYLQQKL